MPDSNWPGYIGVFTGVISLIVSGAAYRRTGTLKALDLRLELRRAEATLREDLKNLEPLMVKAARSRAAVLTATGSFNSGQHKLWQEERDRDAASLRKMQLDLPQQAQDHREKGSQELEAALIKVHILQQQVTQMKEKYSSFLHADDKTRDHIREANQARVNSLMQQRP